MDSYDGLVSRALILGAAACISYVLVGACQRLFLSPIAAFPGPKLAALTFWYVRVSLASIFSPPQHDTSFADLLVRYEFYYDVVKNGQYTFEIERMHKKYGPIVRINPFELHVETPDFYEKLYAGGGKKRDRWEFFTNQFGLPESIAASNEHDKHRIRRAAINPFFSKTAVRRLQPVLDEKMDKLMARFAEYQASQKTMNASLAFEAFTNGLFPL